MRLVDLEDESGIEKPNLIPIEKGRINVIIATLHKICEALEIDVEDLFKPVR